MKITADWFCYKRSPSVEIKLPVNKELDLNDTRKVERLFAENKRKLYKLTDTKIKQSEVYLRSETLIVFLEEDKIKLKEV